jgi:uncharacterized membrane protein
MIPAAVPTSRWVLRLALLALVLLYSTWYVLDSQWVALGVFALPPLLLALALPRGGRRAAFWAGLLALAWFSHGVMVAWSRPSERWFALLETALALVIVFAASAPGLRARFSRGRGH